MALSSALLAQRTELPGEQQKSVSTNQRHYTNHPTAGQPSPLRHQGNQGQSPSSKGSQSSSSGAGSSGAQCYTCGSVTHLARQCPHRHRNGPAEIPGRDRNPTHGGQVATISGQQIPKKVSVSLSESVEVLRQKLHDAEV